MYIASLIFSFITLAMSIVIAFIDPESRFFNYFGDTELYFFMGVSVILLIIGFLSDLRSDHQNE